MVKPRGTEPRLLWPLEALVDPWPFATGIRCECLGGSFRIAPLAGGCNYFPVTEQGCARRALFELTLRYACFGCDKRRAVSPRRRCGKDAVE